MNEEKKEPRVERNIREAKEDRAKGIYVWPVTLPQKKQS